MSATEVTSPRIVQYLSNAILNRRLGHALLFLGEDSTEKENTATRLAAGLLCLRREESSSIPFGCQNCESCKRVDAGKDSHLRLIMSEAEKSRRGIEKDSSASSSEEIRIESVRQLTHEQKMRGYDDGAQIWLLIDGHHLTAQAANALLKTLEEPQSDRFIIILAPTLKSVMPTIASRCQRLIFPAHKGLTGLHQTDASSDIQTLFDRINSSSLSQRLKIAEELSKNKDELAGKLQGLVLLLTNEARKENSSRDQLRLLAEATEAVQTMLKRHVNPALALEELLLKKWPLLKAGYGR